jgi:hypothetical protein
MTVIWFIAVVLLAGACGCFYRCTGNGVLSARLEANDLGERTDVADVDS